jgi:hypothetical protein
MALVALNSNGEINDPNSLDAMAKGQSGKVTGIILPPPDIRAIVEKTAQFVAKHGKSFEEKILNSPEGQSTKFNFMRPHDPYNSYYEFKIKEFEENGGAPPPPPPPPPPKEQVEEAKAADRSLIFFYPQMLTLSSSSFQSSSFHACVAARSQRAVLES